MLSDKEKTLLMQCAAGFISNEELRNQIHRELNFDEFDKLLMDCYNEEDKSLFEAVLWGMPNNLSDTELERLYSKFLLFKNHREHENIVREFQLGFNHNVSNIEILLESMKNIPDYLSFDDFKYPYLRKIIYAIGAQPEPQNLQALEKLTRETNDELLKDLLQHQIKKRKELGRWEAKNAQ